MTDHRSRALVVEDDGSWQQILSEILTDAGLEVDCAANLQEAQEAICVLQHRLAVVDLSLGGGDHTNRDGLLVLDDIRLHDPGCVTILLTGYANVEIAVSAISEHGALTCMRKEAFNRRQFRQIVENALTRLLDSSPPGRGTDMGELPAVELTDGEKAEPSSLPQRDEQPLALVVEDSAAWRESLVEILLDSGFRVHACASYAQALGHLRREVYQLAVIDLSLDGSLPPVTSLWDTGDDDALITQSKGKARHEMYGFRLLASTHAGRIPTVVVSGVANPQDIERAYEDHSIFAFLPKQVFNRQVFRDTVCELVKSSAASRESELAAIQEALTAREQEVLELLARGMTNKEIAEVLVISTNTVKRHLKAVFEKLDVHTRSAAAAKAISAGAASAGTSS